MPPATLPLPRLSDRDAFGGRLQTAPRALETRRRSGRAATASPRR